MACYISIMSMKKICYWVLLGALITPWPMVGTTAYAENNPSRQGFLAKPGVRNAPQVSLQQAINIALSQNGGRLLSAQSKNGQGQRHHIRLLLDGGRVLTVVVDDRGRVQKSR